MHDNTLRYVERFLFLFGILLLAIGLVFVAMMDLSVSSWLIPLSVGFNSGGAVLHVIRKEHARAAQEEEPAPEEKKEKPTIY